VLAGWVAARGISFRTAGPAARGAFLAAALLAGFVPLLMSADAAFAQLVEDAVPTGWSIDQPAERIGVLALFVALGGGLVYARLRPVDVAARPASFALGRVESRIALGTLAALFATFVALQASTLFLRRALRGARFFDRDWARRSPFNTLVDGVARVTGWDAEDRNALKLLYCGQYSFVARRPARG
jgi:hypothetical protein